MYDKKKVTLTTHDWHYKCGDGCCDDYGQDVYVNDTKIDNADIYMDAHGAIQSILEHLGYEVEWKDFDDEEEN